MKKLMSLIAFFVLFTILGSFASDIEIQPTMSSKSNAQDRVWVGSFQLVWNDFMDKIVHNPVKFREGTPVSVHELNKQEFTVNDVSEKSYYKYTGKVKKNTKRVISRAIRKKFGESSDLLDKLELTTRNDMFIIYAMLNKNFEFASELEKLGNFAFKDDDIAMYFGIPKYADPSLARAVEIQFYNDPSDYAVMLKTKGNDEVYLYKNSSNKPFNAIYADMEKKQKAFNGNTQFRMIDELRIPNIKFFEERTFDELANRRIMGTNLVIDKAMETIKFNMNNKGVKLKSEAALTAVTTSLLPPEELVPRFFYYDDTFVIFLKEKGKSKPYFALRVNDITKFQK